MQEAQVAIESTVLADTCERRSPAGPQVRPIVPFGIGLLTYVGEPTRAPSTVNIQPSQYLTVIDGRGQTDYDDRQVYD